MMFLAGDHGAISLYRSALSASRRDDSPGPERVLGGDRQVIAVHTAGPTIAFASHVAVEPA